jgi:hypothetical protein
MTTKPTLSLDGVLHRTPVIWNWISIFLVGYAVYQPAVMEWVNSAPIGTLEHKQAVMAWLDWLCPAAGLLIQFVSKKPTETPEQLQ